MKPHAHDAGLVERFEHSDEMWHWLMRSRTTRIVGAVCQSCEPVDRGPGQEPGPCTRPVWMDDLCAACWCSRMAFHGAWQLFQSNPAASKLSGRSIASRPDIFGSSPLFPFEL